MSSAAPPPTGSSSRKAAEYLPECSSPAEQHADAQRSPPTASRPHCLSRRAFQYVIQCVTHTHIQRSVPVSQHLSVRMDEEVLARLDSESRRIGRSRSWLAKQLLDEGLRMERHPGIVFRSGPAGRRAGLMSGPDVWEVVRAAIGDENTREDIADQIGLTHEQIGVALRYYAEYRDEIGAWIRMVDEEAERAEADWRREQEILAR